MSEQQERLPVTFVQGLYYKLNPLHSDYKPQYALYKCIFSSEMGGVLQRFSEDGQLVGEHYVQHGAKRYIVSDENEKEVQKSYYKNLVNRKEQELEKIQAQCDNISHELKFAKSRLFVIEHPEWDVYKLKEEV